MILWGTTIERYEVITQIEILPKILNLDFKHLLDQCFRSEVRLWDVSDDILLNLVHVEHVPCKELIQSRTVLSDDDFIKLGWDSHHG